jgi:hypothetical protein
MRHVISRPWTVGPALALQVPDATHGRGLPAAYDAWWIASGCGDGFRNLHAVYLSRELGKDGVYSRQVVDKMARLGRGSAQ